MRPELLAEQACGKQTVSMSSLFVIAGPPGAGKTTMSALVSARLSPSALIRGDAFFRFLDQGAVANYAILLHSPDQCVQNVAAREGHVDEVATRDMHDQFQRALIDTRHLLMDPPASPEDTATELLSRYRLGLFAYDARST